MCGRSVSVRFTNRIQQERREAGCSEFAVVRDPSDKPNVLNASQN
jgi:hypothetical protein